MELPVLIEPFADRSGYVAHLGAPFHLRAEAATAEEARQQLATLLRQRLEQGMRLEVIRVPAELVTAAAGAWLQDDELTQEWQREIQQYRQECDEADRRRLLGEPEDGKAAS